MFSCGSSIPIPPLESSHLRIPNSERGVRRKEPDSYYYRHPDIPLRDAIFLPALEEDWQGQRSTAEVETAPLMMAQRKDMLGINE